LTSTAALSRVTAVGKAPNADMLRKKRTRVSSSAHRVRR
jgi:hypothetical protein